MGCTLKKITHTATSGLDYDDALVLLGGTDTPANKKAWTLGNVKFKRTLLGHQLLSTDVRMLIHLGKHYLGQEKSIDAVDNFDIRVTLDDDAA